MKPHPVPPPRAVRFAAALMSVACIAAAADRAAGEDPRQVLPDDRRLADVESPEEFFGFAIGSRHLRHDQIVAYFHHLADHSPRVRLIPYGQTHGRRPLLVASISSPENLEGLDQLRHKRRRLTSGRLDAVPQDALTVMYMGYNVHGDEASAANAAPLVAYHLASSESDEVAGWLAESVFLVDPALNPDGLDRFANWVNEARGRFANPSDVDREHRQPWPGGRTNYYWFDLNRDWLPLVHPESRGRLQLLHQFKPNVVLDYHEMGGTSSYFFQPGVPERNNPLSPEENLRLTRLMAAEHIEAMDAAGELFFTEERFDDFYVGKGSTYPDLHGAVGILFEQGSTRALRLTNRRTQRHFRDTVANQVRTSLSSLRGVAKHRQALLSYQVDFYRQALQAGRQDPRQALVLSGTPQRIAAAADLLARHAIRAYQPEQPLMLEGQQHEPREVLVIPTGQPEYTFIRSLMETPQSFEQNIFYDVSTWHLPSALGLRVTPLESDVPPAWLARRATAEVAEAEFHQRDDIAGYAIAPTELSVPAVIALLLRQDADVRVAPEPVKIERDGQRRTMPAGTFLVLRQPNQRRWDRVVETLQRSAQRDGVAAEPLSSSHTIAGPDLGSSSMVDLKPCQPLLVVGSGTSAYSAGVLWHFLDMRLRQPATLVDVDRVGSVDLDDYSCVILPAGSYGGFGSSTAESLGRYVRGGGTVIAVGSAISMLDRRGLIKIESGDDDDGEQASGGAKAGDAEPPAYADAADARALEGLAGAFLKTRIDPTHPLGYGFPDGEVPVFRDSTVRYPPPGNPYKTVARYQQVIAGYVSDRNRRRILGSAAVWVEPSGSGRYILLVDNPVYRGYVRSSERFLTNAILLGPSLRIPAAPIAP